MKHFVFILLLIACGKHNPSDPDSLGTNPAGGNKFYLGWGFAGPNDMPNMHNEVRTDVNNTFGTFTSAAGGSYQGTRVATPSTQAILGSFEQIRSQITPNDMFVQYSAGHGFPTGPRFPGGPVEPTGLMYGGTFQQIADRLVALPAKEVIVFTMACFSGALVSLLNQNPQRWQDRASQGRTFYVLASSKSNEESKLGPTPDGSAGSVFGWALAAGLKGYADGMVDGFRDGYVSLKELGDYTTYVANAKRGQTPVSTGSYDPNLIISEVAANLQGTPSISLAGNVEHVAGEMPMDDEVSWDGADNSDSGYCH